MFIRPHAAEARRVGRLQVAVRSEAPGGEAGRISRVGLANRELRI